GDPSTNDMIEGGMAIDIAFTGATVTTPELPIAVHRANGALRLRDKSLSVRLDRGMVPAGDGGPLLVSSGAMSIRDLSEKPARAALNATVEGPLSAAVVMAERFNVPELKETPLAPSDVGGTLRAEVGLRTPLGPDVPDEARSWSIDARLTDASSSVPIDGRLISEANVEVLVNRRRIAARGRARIDGLTVDVNYSELFGGEKSSAARFVLTDKDRAGVGFSTGDALRGPVVITVESLQDGSRTFEADLTEAEVNVPGFKKPEGRRLVATGVVAGEASELAVTDLDVSGRGGVSARGEISIGDGALKLAKISGLSLADGDAANLTIERDGKTYLIDFDASRFDGRDLMAGLQPGGGGSTDNDGGAAIPYALDVSASTMRITDENTVSDLSVRARSDGERMLRLSASGKLDDVNAGGFVAELKPAENNTRRLQVDITELGRVLAALDVYKRMRGGRTTIDARFDTDGVVAGRLRANEFVLTNEKTLEGVLQSTQGRRGFGRGGLNDDQVLAFQQATAIDGMSFDKLTIDFTKRGDIINVGEAILRGPILGGTASGAIDLKARTVLLNGTLIPAYGVNNLFGRVPLFGEILGGGNKGGLIGVTFRLAGPLDDPQLTLNPMSAIAPGIFRRIFEFR
ncbi:MAG: AsmA-like C-terminal domain-containing protein, partial [Pseudomonadota bacterium]